MNETMIQRQPKRKCQPSAERMREQLRLAADEIIRLRGELETLRSAGIGYFFGSRWPNGYTVDKCLGEIVDPAILKAKPWWRRMLGRWFV